MAARVTAVPWTASPVPVDEICVAAGNTVTDWDTALSEWTPSVGCTVTSREYVPAPAGMVVSSSGIATNADPDPPRSTGAPTWWPLSEKVAVPKGELLVAVTSSKRPKVGTRSVGVTFNVMATGMGFAVPLTPIGCRRPGSLSRIANWPE